MSEDVYKAPAADLINLEKGELTASERWAQTRKEMAAENARSKLNLVWGIRLVTDIFVIGVLVFFVWQAAGKMRTEGLFFFGFFLFFYLLEMAAIIGYFKQRKWSIVPLHIFSAISLLNVPGGTILSVIHYIYAGKLNFEK